MAKQPRVRRAFSAEFKLEAVRRLEEQRPRGVSLAQVGRELGVRPDLLRVWAKQVEQVHARAGAPPRDVFPGQGRLPSEQEELRRLQRENARLQQEVEFLKKAAVDSMGECNAFGVLLHPRALWRRSVVPASRPTNDSRSGRCGRRASPSP